MNKHYGNKDIAKNKHEIPAEYIKVESKLNKLMETNQGLQGYVLDDIVLPGKDIEKLAYLFRKGTEKDKNENEVKTAQVRKIFYEIKKLYTKHKEGSLPWSDADGDDIRTGLLLIMPKITYANARELLGKTVKLGDIFIDAIRATLNDDKDIGLKCFERLYQFTESFVAYHKKYAPKD